MKERGSLRRVQGRQEGCLCSVCKKYFCHIVMNIVNLEGGLVQLNPAPAYGPGPYREAKITIVHIHDHNKSHTCTYMVKNNS